MFKFWKKSDKPLKWWVDFVPQSDITPYELALCLKWYVFILYGGDRCSDGDYIKSQFDQTHDEKVKRHFIWTKI